MNPKLIDHTQLKAFATQDDIKSLCKEAINYKFKSVCVNPSFIKLAKQELQKSDVLVCTVIGFPLGANTTETKVFETLDAIKNGADEIDMVINVSAIKDKQFDYVLEDIKSVVHAADKKTVKVILETCYLTNDEIKTACELCEKAQATFVKTSTGFGTRGASLEDVKLMRQSTTLEIKASGGVSNQDDVAQFVKEGATRIGTSKGVSIMGGKNNDSNSTY